jgi:hypothetical protein
MATELQRARILKTIGWATITTVAIFGGVLIYRRYKNKNRKGQTLARAHRRGSYLGSPVKAGVDYAPATDRSGTALHPGDKVSFKTYPQGTARGEVMISTRAKENYGGEWLPALIIKSEDTTYPLVSKGVRKLRKGIDGAIGSLAFPRRDTLHPDEVARLPVGSIVWPWVGRVDGSPWVVNQGNVLLPISVLPVKASGHFPDDGEVPASVASEFVLVSKGRGKLPTHGTASKLSGKYV